MKKLKIMSVCGFGIGSSLILKMKIDEVLKAENIDAETSPQDITSATSGSADIIFTSNELYPQIKDKVSCPIIAINNFMDTKEISEKGLPVIRELMNK